jgi:hypothetical protein
VKRKNQATEKQRKDGTSIVLAHRLPVKATVVQNTNKGTTKEIVQKVKQIKKNQRQDLCRKGDMIIVKIKCKCPFRKFNKNEYY